MPLWTWCLTVTLIVGVATACSGASENQAQPVSPAQLAPASPASAQRAPTTATTATPIPITPKQEEVASFFIGVLQKLGVPPEESAVGGLLAWTKFENTSAKWNLLATTLKSSGSSPLNTSGVQNYPDRATGIQATADTLSLPYYKAIIDMLKGDSFDQSALRQALNTWSGSGGYVPSLLDEWERLWNSRASKVPPSTTTGAPMPTVPSTTASSAGSPDVKSNLEILTFYVDTDTYPGSSDLYKKVRLQWRTTTENLYRLFYVNPSPAYFLRKPGSSGTFGIVECIPPQRGRPPGWVYDRVVTVGGTLYDQFYGGEHWYVIKDCYVVSVDE